MRTAGPHTPFIGQSHKPPFSRLTNVTGQYTW